MNLRLRTRHLFLILLLFLGCTPGPNKSKGNLLAETPQEKGKIFPKVTCMKDHSYSYALYLPKSYDNTRRWPVILAFDPHGNGSLPVEKYKDLAENYGYILMGSNDSRNGQDMNTSTQIMDAMLGETKGRYSIDTERICAIGFSGGARIAIIFGFYMGGPSCVIGCGAGFPQTTHAPDYRPDYIAMVGNADFNMTELINLDKELDEVKFSHALVLFNGSHDWPPVEVMEKGFIYHKFCDMRKNHIKKDDAMISSYIQAQEQVIEKDKQAGDELSLHGHLVNLIRFTDQLSTTDAYNRQLSEVEKSPAYVLQKKQFQAVLDKEIKEHEELNTNFFPKDTDWWKKKIAGYEKRITKGRDSADVRMCRRLKSYLSLLSYMNYSRVVQTKDTSSANHALQIYELVDPENATKTKAGVK